ncbi:MAG TPA: alpha/beta hydrolase fold domain-containing protein [Fibrobacteria bacterium]|nr:alpha/beta hydrolase fold domain-containing protein [Fibrobacteria bacterium]HOX51256.1 alpha/beta hydrolase fold domain-containing protein [Fibrobacteria bacterium]
MNPRFALLALSMGIVLGCSDSSTSPDATPPAKSTPESLSSWAPDATPSLPGDAVVEIASLGARWDSVANLARYQAEVRKDLAGIFAEWNARKPAAADWDTIKSVAQSNGTTHMVAFSVDGVAQGGLIWTPSVTGPKPVVLFGHPGDNGVDDNFAGVLSFLMGSTWGRCIVVMPAFRGEDASLSGVAIAGDATKASPWDRDVDDGLAMLQAVLSRNPQADASRIAAVGYSRGAGVALLSALRERRIKGVYEIAGPTDFFAPSIQNLSKALAAGASIDLPGLDAIESRYLAPFRNGTISADSLRTVLLARSAARLAISGLLPATVAVHGTADSVVHPDQTIALKAADSRVDYQSVTGMTHTSGVLGANQPQVAQSLQAFLKTTLALP